MTIDKATEQQVTDAISRWEERFREAKRNGWDFEARQFSSWLFGLERGLGLLGLDDLAQRAIAAQRDSGA